MSAQPGRLEGELDRLSSLAEQYQRRYSTRRLSVEEVIEARGRIVEMRNLVLEMRKLWGDFADTGTKVEAVLSIFRSDALAEKGISEFSTSLTMICTMGAGVLQGLDNPLMCTAHYKRQCFLMDDSDAILRQQDAAELESSLEHLATRLRDDVECQRWYIQLVSLYSQTKLAIRMRRLNTILVVLTFILIAGTIIAAVTGVLSLTGG